MTEQLSNDQIAALVAAAREGQTPREQPRRRPRRVREIDFTRPTKFTQDQQRRVERSHQAFCRTMSTRLSAELRSPVELEVINVDQLAWATAVDDIPSPSVYANVGIPQLDTTVLLAAEQSVLARMVERMLGGPCARTRQVEREPTEIELAITRRVFTGLVSQLSVTWTELLEVQLELGALETNVVNVQIAPPSEPALALTIELRWEGSSSTLSLAIPWRAIEPVAERIPSGQYSDFAPPAPSEQATAAVRSTLEAVEVELRAEVAAVELPLERVLELRAGDVLRLGAPASAGVSLCVGTIPVHRAKPGRHGSSRAVEVIERLEQRT